MMGIYSIKCLISKKEYIGSAINLKTRERKHKESLERNDHDNAYLQRAWNKHGKDNFVFETIEEVNDVNLLIEREQYWIDSKESYRRSKGYNLCPIAGSLLGFKHSEESKLKVSKSYIVTNLLKEEILITNLSKFCKNNNLSTANLSLVASGIVGQHKGWECRFADVSKEDWEQLVAQKSKAKWQLINPDGKEYWVRSKDINDFCIKNNLSIHSLRDINRGRKESIKGWKAKFYSNKKIYNTPKNAGPLSEESKSKIRNKLSREWIVTNPFGVETVIFNLNEFCRINNLLSSEMLSIAQGNTDFHHDWQCRYAEMSKDEWIKLREEKRKPNKGLSANWLLIDSDGNEYIVNNLKEFCRNNNLCDHLMRNLDKGRSKYYKGWKCKKLG